MDENQEVDQLISLLPPEGKRNTAKYIESILMRPDEHIVQGMREHYGVEYADLSEEWQDALRGGFVSRLQEILADLILAEPA